MALQYKPQHITDDENFHAILDSDTRLIVIDVYSPWCGPCTVMEKTYSSLMVNIDNFEDRCVILQIPADSVTDLQKYNGTSRPRFLFYKDKVFIKEILGSNVIEIIKSINQYIPPLENIDN